MTEAYLHQLLDAEKIRDVVQAFCESLDRAEIDNLVELFAPEGTMDLGGGAVYRGHSEIREMFLDRLLLYKTSSLHCSGTRIKNYNGCSAIVSSSLYAFFDATNEDLQMQVWGRYDDVVVLQSGAWRFLERHLLIVGISHLKSQAVPKRFSQIHRNEMAPEGKK